jgi:hypothetical protein
LVPNREYRLLASVRRQIANGADFTAYGDLYNRATAIANARIAELKCTDERPHAWILCQGWRRIEIGAANDLLIAFQTIGLLCPTNTDAKPQGEPAPAHRSK